MKLFLDYISKIKFYIILQLFPVMLAEIIFFLYQLPIEPMVYVTVFWLITGICACLNGFYRYRKKVEQLELIAAAPISIFHRWILLSVRMKDSNRKLCSS